MRLGIFTDAFPDRPLADVLDWLEAEASDVRELEIGVGAYSRAPHVDDLGIVESRGFRVAALNASGNPLERADHDRALRDAIALAAKLGVGPVVCMSGGNPRTAGGGWFPELEEETAREWEDGVLPYWREVGALAERSGVWLCFELEPGSAVYNTATFERLAGVSPAVRLNLDPSHFFWQKIDPLAVVRRVGRRIGWAHGKDTFIDCERVAVDGLLDRGAWHYAAVGSGRGADWWRALVRELAGAGYDGVLSIEVEDPTMPPEEAVVRSGHVLREAVREGGMG